MGLVEAVFRDWRKHRPELGGEQRSFIGRKARVHLSDWQKQWSVIGGSGGQIVAVESGVQGLMGATFSMIGAWWKRRSVIGEKVAFSAWLERYSGMIKSENAALNGW